MAKKTDNQEGKQQQAAGADQGKVQDPPPNDAAASGPDDLEHVDEGAIWKELDQEEVAAKAPSDDAKGSSDKDAGAAADQDQDSQDASNQQSGSDDASAAGGKSAGKAAGSQEDIWANATPAQQAAYKAAQEEAQKGVQYKRSQEGRIASLQRKVDELVRAPAASAAGKKDKQDVADDILNDPDLLKTAKEYPEIAGPFIKIIGKLLQQQTGQAKFLTAIGDERRQTAMDEQKDYLTTEHSDWEAVAEREEFTPWLNAQPRHIREAFHRNATDIVDGQEAADVIGRFKDHLRANGQYQDAQQPSDGKAQQQNGTQAGNGNGNGQQLDAKRQRQYSSASSTRTRGPGVAAGIPEEGDPKAIWKQMDELDARAAQQRA